MSLVLKDPSSALDYLVNWGATYLADEDIVESSWSVVPIESGGITIDGTTLSPRQTTVKISGGKLGKIYRLINQVTTSVDREDSRSIMVRVEAR